MPAILPEFTASDSDVVNAVSINEDDIMAEYASVPHDLMVWGVRQANAAESVSAAKFALERVEAKLYFEQREILRAEYGTKRGEVTEAMINGKVRRDGEYEDARLDYIENEARYARTRAVCEALKAKRDMLISVGATQRAEARTSGF